MGRSEVLRAIEPHVSPGVSSMLRAMASMPAISGTTKLDLTEPGSVFVHSIVFDGEGKLASWDRCFR